MFNLIKNELIKIFSKKGIYIVLLISLLLTIAFIALEKNANNIMPDNYIEEELKYEKENLKTIDTSTEEGKEWYSYSEGYIQFLELLNKYGENSWQSSIINEKLLDIIIDLNYYKNGLEKYVMNITLSKEQLQEQYDSILKKLDSGDWKVFVKDSLSEINAEIIDIEKAMKEVKDFTTSKNLEQQLEILKISKQVLEWRLEKNICYGDEEFDGLLFQFEQNGHILLEYNYKYDINENNYKEKQATEYDYEAKKFYQGALGDFNTAKYKIENQISSETTASSLLQNLFLEDGLLFTIIISVMLFGSTVSEEFNKGTIKLLLIRPYGRRKILFSKLIACSIAIIFSIVIILILQTLVLGIAYGFNTADIPVVSYNFNSNSVITINIFEYLLINILSVSPIIIILGLIAFLIGTVLTSSTTAITISLLTYMLSSIFTSMAMAFNIKCFKFIPFINWDLTQYLYGKLPTIEGMTLGFSICICLITIIVLVTIAFENFARKNIKNI